jgi:hypothetical protein
MSGTSLTGSRFSDAALPKIQAGVGRIGSMRAAVSAINQGVDIEEIKRTRNEMMDEMKSINRSLSEPIIPQNQRLNALQNQFADLAQTAPQAPQFQAPGQPSDLQSALSIIAQLAAPNRDRAGIALAPYQAADAIAQRQNQFNQNEFQVDQANFAQQVNNLQKQIQVEADQVRTLYGVEIDQRQILRQRLNDLMDSLGQNNAQLMLQQSREVDDTRQQQVVNNNRLKAMQLALDGIFKSVGKVDDNYNKTFAGFVPEIMQMYGVDQATAAQMLSRIETGTKTATQSNADRNFGLRQDDQALRRQQLESNNAYRNASLKARERTEAFKQWKGIIDTFKVTGRVTEQDRQDLIIQANEFAKDFGIDPRMLPIPQVGKSWNLVMAEQNATIRQNEFEERKANNQWDRYYNSKIKPLETATQTALKAEADARDEYNKVLADKEAAERELKQTKENTRERAEAEVKVKGLEGRLKIANDVFEKRKAQREGMDKQLQDAWDAQPSSDEFTALNPGPKPDTDTKNDKKPGPKPEPKPKPKSGGGNNRKFPRLPDASGKTNQSKDKQGPPNPKVNSKFGEFK